MKRVKTDTPASQLPRRGVVRDLIFELDSAFTELELPTPVTPCLPLEDSPAGCKNHKSLTQCTHFPTGFSCREKPFSYFPLYKAPSSCSEILAVGNNAMSQIILKPNLASTPKTLVFSLLSRGVSIRALLCWRLGPHVTHSPSLWAVTS